MFGCKVEDGLSGADRVLSRVYEDHDLMSTAHRVQRHVIGALVVLGREADFVLLRHTDERLLQRHRPVLATWCGSPMVRHREQKKPWDRGQGAERRESEADLHRILNIRVERAVTKRFQEEEWEEECGRGAMNAGGASVESTSDIGAWFIS